jgi:hypothetical protein
VSTERSPNVLKAFDLINKSARFAGGLGRGDLVDRLRATYDRLADPAVRVFVVGEYKKGKSSLVNAIVDASVCKVDCDAATSVPTAVRYADEPVALVYPESQDGEPQPIPLDDLHAYHSETGNGANVRELRLVEAGLPREVLADGLVLVDTPGVGGIVSAHGIATMQALPAADAVVFVTDASQELTAPELDFLTTARELCPTILCAVSKTDMYPEWERIRNLDREHIQRAGLDVPVGAVSSVLRQHALRARGAQADAESGFPQLIRFLRERVVAAAEQVSLRGVANDVVWTANQLELALSAEREALADPGRSADLVAELERAKQQATGLRDQSARWQQNLNDGVTDLMADVDYDLRTRLRELTRVAEETLDGCDPADHWHEFEQWLYQRISADVTHNYAAMGSGAETLAHRVAELFDADAPTAPSIVVDAPSETIASTQISLGTAAVKRTGIPGQGMTLLRNAYGSMAIVSMMSGIAGLALTMSNPITMALGLLSGAKGVRDQRTRERDMRRTQAKASVRRFIDDVSFQITKDKSDQLRRIQRELRDAFTGRAAEMQRSTSEALAAAQAAVQSDQQSRQKRLGELQEALRAVAGMRAEAGALTPTSS